MNRTWKLTKSPRVLHHNFDFVYGAQFIILTQVRNYQHFSFGQKLCNLRYFKITVFWKFAKMQHSDINFPIWILTSKNFTSQKMKKVGLIDLTRMASRLKACLKLQNLAPLWSKWNPPNRFSRQICFECHFYWCCSAWIMNLFFSREIFVQSWFVAVLLLLLAYPRDVIDLFTKVLLTGVASILFYKFVYHH